MGPDRMRRRWQQLQDWRLPWWCVPVSCSAFWLLTSVLASGLVCNDAGITSGVIVSEYGYANFGQWGGERTSWDLSRVGLQINLDTKLTSSDGQSVQCSNAHCPDDQAYSNPSDYAADRNSPLGRVYEHRFCP
jgi:hypothetical protein